MCDKNSGELTDKEGENMTPQVSIPKDRKSNISKALREVRLMKQGKSPKKFAREFLKESRKK